MATLVKQHGRYYLQFYDKHRSPQRKRVPLKVTRKREAEKHQRRLERKYREQEYDPWTDDPFTLQKKDEKPRTLKESLSAFIEAKEAAGRSENTIRSYRGIIRRLMERFGNDSLLQNLSGEDLTPYIRDPEVAETTQHKRYRHVKAFLRWCLDQKLITRNPLSAVEPPDEPQKLPKVMSEENLASICDALSSTLALCRVGNRVQEPVVKGLGWLPDSFRNRAGFQSEGDSDWSNTAEATAAQALRSFDLDDRFGRPSTESPA